MTPAEIQDNVERLAKKASWPGCPNGGWQYPFDFGFGIEAPTYSATQRELHPWRKHVTFAALDRYFSGRYQQISVLDLGAGECAFAAELWQRGTRDITCVEMRDINVEKALFVREVFGCGFNVVQDDVERFLSHDQRTYDLVLFMGLLYHLQDPLNITRKVAAKTREMAVVETVLACPENIVFNNVPEYRPEQAAYFIRKDSQESNTAGAADIELWPTSAALTLTLQQAEFQRLEDIVPAHDALHWYATKQRTLLLAHKG